MNKTLSLAVKSALPDTCSHGLAWGEVCLACDIVQTTWAIELFERLLAERKNELAVLCKAQTAAMTNEGEV